jgi:predicted phosphodiesterase
MKLLVLSDLHIERSAFEPPRDGYDRVVLAGDIHNGVRAIEWARATFPHVPVLQIAGNHEYYDHVLPPCLDAMREAARRLEVDFLECDRRIVDGVEFLGCTLWTDYRAFESPGRAHRLSREQALVANRAMIFDHVAIGMPAPSTPEAPDGVRRFAGEDAIALHEDSRDWLEAALARPHDGPRVVITHHLPSWRSVSPAFADSVTNAAYVTDLDHLVGASDLWIHGHTHGSARYDLGDARVVCNARGYPRRRHPGTHENPAFDPGLVVEVPDRR